MNKKLKTFALLRPIELVLFGVLLMAVLTYAPGIARKAVLVACIIAAAAARQRKNLRVLKEQAGLLEYVRLHP